MWSRWPMLSVRLLGHPERRAAHGRQQFIVATDSGMLHKLRTLNPGKTFIEAPTAGNSATCKSCAHCPWMAMNGLAGLAHVLETGAGEVHVEPALGCGRWCRSTACWPSRPRCGAARPSITWSPASARAEPSGALERAASNQPFG